jgi:hypothetical protein
VLAGLAATFIGEAGGKPQAFPQWIGRSSEDAGVWAIAAGSEST